MVCRSMRRTPSSTRTRCRPRRFLSFRRRYRRHGSTRRRWMPRGMGSPLSLVRATAMARRSFTASHFAAWSAAATMAPRAVFERMSRSPNSSFRQVNRLSPGQPAFLEACDAPARCSSGAARRYGPGGGAGRCGCGRPPAARRCPRSVRSSPGRPSGAVGPSRSDASLLLPSSSSSVPATARILVFRVVPARNAVFCRRFGPTLTSGSGLDCRVSPALFVRNHRNGRTAPSASGRGSMCQPAS